jgi:hypothetical protein
MRFERRAQVIITSARLYNLCINKRIKDDLCEKAGLTEIQPDRWALTPLFDKEGPPVEYLKTGSKEGTKIAVAASAAAAKADRTSTLQTHSPPTPHEHAHCRPTRPLRRAHLPTADPLAPSAART